MLRNKIMRGALCALLAALFVTAACVAGLAAPPENPEMLTEQAEEAAPAPPAAAINGASFEPETVYQSSQADFTLHLGYTALTPGKAYYVTATLLDPETGQPYLVSGQQITETRGLVPEGSDGIIDIIFSQDISTLEGTKSLVPTVQIAQEGGAVVAVSGEGMPPITIVSPVLTQTFLSSAGTGRIPNNGFTDLVQTITYRGLEPGQKYTLNGTLCAGRVEMPIELENGAGYRATQNFVPTAENGQVVLTYKVDGGSIPGVAIVPAWELYKGQNLVAILRDATLEPKIAVAAPEPTPTPVPTVTPSPAPSEEPTEELTEEPDVASADVEEIIDETASEELQVQSGGGMNVVILIVVIGGAAAAAYFLLFRRKK